ncbi:MAG TPA: hypothetical protein DFR83_07405, partial [Deltaproteobacteria bacterium]|nr:hypothetical protein [Deltaproteobacteria bacterium]
MHDIRTIRLALADTACHTITLTEEFPAVSAPIDVQRDVVINAGPWSVPPLRIAADDGADNAPYVVLLGGLLTPDRAVAVPADPRDSDVDADDLRTLPVVIEVTGSATLLLAETTISVPASPDENPTALPILQHADQASTVGLFGVRTADPLESTLAYQEVRAESGACPSSVASFQTDDLAALLPTLERTGRFEDALVALSHLDRSQPNRIALDPNGGLLGTACWDLDEGFKALEGTGETHLARLQLTGIGTPHVLKTSSDEAALPWSVVHAAGPVVVTESLFDTLATRDRPVVWSPTALRLTHTLVAELTLSNAPLVSAPELVVDHGILCDLVGSDVLVELHNTGEGSTHGTLSRLAIDGLGIGLAAPHSDATLTLQHLTARGDGIDLVRSEAHGSTTLLHSYLEGALDLGSIAASPNTVRGLRLVGAECLDGLEDCITLSSSALPTGASDCSVVLRQSFRQYSALAAWPIDTAGLPRLWLDAQVEDQVYTDNRSDLWTDDDTLACLESADSEELLVGAWPSAACGLDALTPIHNQPPESEPDTGMTFEEPTEAPPAALGCAGRAAGLLALGLL